MIDIRHLELSGYQPENNSGNSRNISAMTPSCNDNLTLPDVFVRIPIHSVSNEINSYSRENQNSHQIKSEESIKSELTDIQLSLKQNNNLHQRNLEGSTTTNLVIAKPKTPVQTPIKCHKCDLCPFMTISFACLNEHITNCHSKSINKNDVNNNFKRLACPGCKNIFYMKTSFEAHLENDHQMVRNEIEQLIESLLNGASFLSENENRKNRIYLKNVDCLRIPRIEKNNTNENIFENNIIESNFMLSENEQFITTNNLSFMDLMCNNKEIENVQTEMEEENSNPNKISIKNVNILKETGIISSNQGTTNTSIRDSMYSNEVYYDITTECTNHIQTNPAAPINDSMTALNEDTEKPRRAKIYIKNVDILKKPIVLPPNNLTNILDVNDELRLNFFPSSDDLRSINSIIPFQSTSNINLSVTETNKDYSSNQLQYDIPRKLTNSLHLRTVDELNLMNMNEVKNLITPALIQTGNCLETVNRSSENSKNSDEILNNYNIIPDLVYNNYHSEFNPHEEGLMQTNWASDYNFSNFENIIDSNSSFTNLEKKNSNTSLIEFDLNTPQRSIIDENDEDILFVCAQEIISANIGKKIDSQNDVGIINLSRTPLLAAQNTVEVSDDFGTQEDSQLEKGRIYVSDNLMENKIEKNNVNNLKKNRGRPFGARQYRFGELKNIRSKKNSSQIGYKCDLNCAIRFKNLENLEYHKRCHISSTQYQMKCPECNIDSFRSFNTLHTHLWRCHKINMELYSCNDCDFKTPCLSRLINTHSRIHSNERKFKCNICEKTFKNAKQLKNHRRLHRYEETKEIQKCSLCGATFSYLKTLKEHIRVEHEGNEEFKCLLCNKIMSSKSALKLHTLTHENLSKFKCENCSYTSNDHNAFRRHKMIHDGSKMYSCKYCDYKCIQSNLYKKHIIRKHPDYISDVILKCDDCSFNTINQSKFHVHIAKHKNCDNIILQTNENLLDSVNDLSTLNEFNVSERVHMENTSESYFKNKIKVKSNSALTDPSRFCNENDNFDKEIS